MLSKDEIKQVKDGVNIKDYVNQVILKEIPWYYSDYTVDLDSKAYIKCPLHGEDTPSFRVYDDTNTFYCFGCGAGGDVIRLHQLFVQSLSNSKVSFEDAVKFLKNKFVSSNTVVKKIRTKKQVENSGKDLLKLNKLYKEIEATLKMDKSIREEDKQMVYDSIDLALAFVELKKIPAITAVAYIKDSYNKLLEGGHGDI